MICRRCAVLFPPMVPEPFPVSGLITVAVSGGRSIMTGGALALGAVANSLPGFRAAMFLQLSAC